MLIEIIAVGSKQKVKTYYSFDLSYKDLDKDKVSAKKLMSFSYPEVFNTLSSAEKGEVYEIDLKKEGEYWNWVNATKTEKTESKPSSPAPTRVTGNNYETREERELRQTHIIRESCLSTAATFLANKGEVSNHDVISFAADLEQWVLRPKDPMQAIKDFPDDIPD